MINFIKNPFIFIGIIAFFAAMILATFSESTREKVKNNKDLDRKRNVLLARYLEDFKDPNHPYIAKLSKEDELKDIYSSEIEELIFNSDGSLAKLKNDVTFNDLVWKEDANAGPGKEGQILYSFKNDLDEYLPLFKVLNTGGYIIPISGKGLWSTIKGFIYIIPNDLLGGRNDGEYLVKGVSFYEHGETPGLGGEIDKYEVKARYLNKQISLKNNKTPKMTKTIVDERYDLEYISGATVTSDGLDTFIEHHILNRYSEILKNSGKKNMLGVNYE
ncbi:MAG: hypothetical protein CMG00_02640 [Candidatus Marinimicrobia bacterium]|nr:hypothetical protein [Candidatus Neomarinimicrobiota bacterium]|tara:strand:- start:4445 stop:5266 length:822 start_codon:yes stop_codon:yes gene_type:complete